MEQGVKKYSPIPDSFTVVKSCNSCEHRWHEMCRRYEHFIGYVRARDRACANWEPSQKYWKDVGLVIRRRDKENLSAK